MNYLHYEFDLEDGDVGVVTLDKQANVHLLEGPNYSNYENGRCFTYYGGFARTSPLRLSPPSSGHWPLTIDLGGYSGTVHASVNIEQSGVHA